MLGKRSDQKGLWEADRLYLDYVGKDTFYGLLASLRGQLFSDDDFAEIYCPDNGRDSVPPSLLATALLLQTYDKVSDAEAKARADRRQLVLPVATTILAGRDGQSSRPPANSCAGHRLCRYTVRANSIDTPPDSHKGHYVKRSFR